MMVYQTFSVWNSLCRVLQKNIVGDFFFGWMHKDLSNEASGRQTDRVYISIVLFGLGVMMA